MPAPSLPLDVASALSRLDESDRQAISAYIAKLDSTIASLEKRLNITSNDDDDEVVVEDALPMYTGDPDGGDYDVATTAKMAAADYKDAGDYNNALAKYNEAITAAPPTALLLANRAAILLSLQRYDQSIHDCDAALLINPDSAKALRIRGECYMKQTQYHRALIDLGTAQTADYDDNTAILLKEVKDKCAEIDAEKVRLKNMEEDKLRKKAMEIKKAKASSSAAAAAAAASSSRGMPGGMPGMGGMPEGMPDNMAGMGGMMAGLMSDPEISAGMKNPKIMAAFTSLMSGPGGPMGLMSNPAKLQELMTDPEVGPFMQKLMGKVMGGGMGGMGGMGGGMGGRGFDDDHDDMPDLDGDDMPDLVD